MLTSILAGIGVAAIVYSSYRVYSVFGYYSKPCKLSRYLHGNNTWALVTGASDGIGFGLAEELAHRGFNVVLHGRNPNKLENRKKQLQLKYPDRSFSTVVADASLAGDAAIKQIHELVVKMPPNLTVLINNVGGGAGDRTFSRFLDRSLAEVSDLMAVNEGFPTLLTRALLPKLVENQPALIVNLGSALDEWSSAYVEPYSAAKAHNKSFNQAIRTEMALEGYDVELLHIRVMAVATPSSREPVSWWAVSPRVAARGYLDRAGSGVASTAGCFRHEMIMWMVGLLMSNEAVSKGASGMVKHKIVEASKPRE